MSRLKPSFSVSSGNSAVEYALPLAVIGTVLLMGLYTIQPNLTGSLSRTFNGNLLPGDEKVFIVSPMGANPNVQSLTLQLAGGQSLTLPGYPMDLALSVEVDGSNGTTEKLLANLNSLAQQLKANGSISETQFNQLEALSNNGHRIAQVEQLLENAAANAKTKAEFANQTITYEGKTFSVGQALVLIGGSIDLAPGDRLTDLVTPVTQFDTELTNQLVLDSGMHEKQITGYGYLFADYVTSYSEILNTGGLQQPAVKQVVSDLSRKILDISVKTSRAAMNTLVSDTDVQPRGFNNQVASDLSHTHSAGICTVGGGEDSGVQCPRQKS